MVLGFLEGKKNIYGFGISTKLSYIAWKILITRLLSPRDQEKYPSNFLLSNQRIRSRVHDDFFFVFLFSFVPSIFLKKISLKHRVKRRINVGYIKTCIFMMLLFTYIIWYISFNFQVHIHISILISFKFSHYFLFCEKKFCIYRWRHLAVKSLTYMCIYIIACNRSNLSKQEIRLWLDQSCEGLIFTVVSGDYLPIFFKFFFPLSFLLSFFYRRYQDSLNQLLSNLWSINSLNPLLSNLISSSNSIIRQIIHIWNCNTNLSTHNLYKVCSWVSLTRILELIHQAAPNIDILV